MYVRVECVCVYFSNLTNVKFWILERIVAPKSMQKVEYLLAISLALHFVTTCMNLAEYSTFCLDFVSIHQTHRLPFNWDSLDFITELSEEELPET